MIKSNVIELIVLSICLCGCSAGNDAVQKEAEEVFFNGTDLTGWSSPNMEYWSVKEKAIVGQTPGDLAKNEFLWSQVRVTDFYLSVDVLLQPENRNAGIQFRSKMADSSGQAIGYQADVGDNNGQGVWGTIYDEHGRGTLDGSSVGSEVVKPGKWNHYEMLAIDDRIWTAINGKIVAALKDPDGERSGYIAFQIHSGPHQVVSYRINKLVHEPPPVLAGLTETQLNSLLHSPLKPESRP